MSCARAGPNQYQFGSFDTELEGAVTYDQICILIFGAPMNFHCSNYAVRASSPDKAIKRRDPWYKLATCLQSSRCLLLAFYEQEMPFEFKSQITQSCQLKACKLSGTTACLAHDNQTERVSAEVEPVLAASFILVILSG